MTQFFYDYSKNYNIFNSGTIDKYKAYYNYNPSILKIQIITNVLDNSSHPILDITYKLLIADDIIIANKT